MELGVSMSNRLDTNSVEVTSYAQDFLSVGEIS